MGPVEQVLAQQQANTDTIFRGFQLGSSIAQFATQARLSLRSQALQEQGLKLEQQRINLSTLDFQQRSQLFELQKEKWSLERKQIEAEIAVSAALAPWEKLKAAAGLQAGQRQLEGQAEFESFGADAIGAIQNDAVRQKREIMDGRVPDTDPGMLDLFRLYPNLMTHREIKAAQDASNKDVADFRDRWMMTTGRSGTAAGGVTGFKINWLENKERELASAVESGTMTQGEADAKWEASQATVLSAGIVNRVENAKTEAKSRLMTRLEAKIAIGKDSPIGDAYFAHVERSLGQAKTVQEVSDITANLFEELGTIQRGMTPAQIPPSWKGKTPAAPVPSGIPTGSRRTKNIGGVEVIEEDMP